MPQPRAYSDSVFAPRSESKFAPAATPRKLGAYKRRSDGDHQSERPEGSDEQPFVERAVAVSLHEEVEAKIGY
eukprot:2374079-Prymnesium_polylepis.1